MMFEPFKPYLSAEFLLKRATETWESRGAAALRRSVFCDEQGIFDRNDRDDVDAEAMALVALAMMGVVAEDVVGTVRIHRDGDEQDAWWGSRLAVHRDYRRLGVVGAGLIRLAVSSAHAFGCRRFLAHVQSQNVLLFQRMHWRSLGEVDFHGRPHHRMEADLAYYPPCATPEIGFLSLPKLAA